MAQEEIEHNKGDRSIYQGWAGGFGGARSFLCVCLGTKCYIAGSSRRHQPAFISPGALSSITGIHFELQLSPILSPPVSCRESLRKEEEGGLRIANSLVRARHLLN